MIQPAGIFSRRNVPFLLLAFLFLVPALILLPSDMMDIDSAQYAEIGREMTDSNNYFYIRDNGSKYLDKPVLTFWLISASFKIFGQNNVAFRLPSILFALLSLYSIYRITLLRSGGERRALFAALLYASSPGLLSMLMSPLIDIYLTSFLIFTHHACYLARKKNPAWYYLMYLFMGMGFITKGPIAIVIPGISIGVDLLIRRDWKTIAAMKIPQGIMIAGALPALWSWILFQDFSWYGPHFFLIIQSFGRFYSFIYNQRFDPLFFVKNFAWAFGLFIVPLAASVALTLRHRWVERLRLYSASRAGTSFIRWLPRGLLDDFRSASFRGGDYVIPLWLFLTLALISMSRFQLPQYVYWILPSGAIFFAGILSSTFPGEGGTETPADSFRPAPLWSFFVAPVMYACILIAVPVVAFDVPWHVYLLLSTPLLLFVFRESFSFPLLVTFTLGLAGHLCAVLIAYPELIRYQPASRVAQTVQRLEPDEKVLYKFMISTSKRSYAFYSKRYLRDIWYLDPFIADVRKSGSRLLLMSGEGLSSFDAMTGNRFQIQVLEEYPSYKVSTPSARFFNRKKRPGLLKKVVLARVTLRPERR